jgi:phage terminase large subunit-like protein
MDGVGDAVDSLAGLGRLLRGGRMTRDEYRRRLRGRRLFVGMDLSSTKDLTALAGVLPDDEGFDVIAQFFCPKDNIHERSLRDRVPYEDWARMGPDILMPTPGNVVDYEYPRQTLHDWAAEFDLKIIAYDPWNALDLVTRLKDQDGLNCVPMRQGFASLSAPTKSLEKAVLSKALRHDGHPVLRWCVGNVCVEQDAPGNIKISKKVSTERIDGVAALVMAVDQMERNSVVKPAFQMIVLGQ